MFRKALAIGALLLTTACVSRKEAADRFESHVNKFFQGRFDVTYEISGSDKNETKQFLLKTRNGYSDASVINGSGGKLVLIGMATEIGKDKSRAKNKDEISYAGKEKFAGRKCEMYEIGDDAYCFGDDSALLFAHFSRFWDKDADMNFTATRVDNKDNAVRVDDKSSGSRRTTPRNTDKSDEMGVTQARIKTVGTAIAAYAVDSGSYPYSYGEIPVEMIAGELRPYMRNLPLTDGWGNQIMYENTGDSFCVRSPGKDGIFESQSCVHYTRQEVRSPESDIVFFRNTFVRARKLK